MVGSIEAAVPGIVLSFTLWASPERGVSSGNGGTSGDGDTGRATDGSGESVCLSCEGDIKGSGIEEDISAEGTTGSGGGTGGTVPVGNGVCGVSGIEKVLSIIQITGKQKSLSRKSF